MEEILNTTTKVFLILGSIKDSKYRYIAIINPNTNEKIMKIKLNLGDQEMVDFVDTFFDNGFIIESIDKEEFDSLQTNDIMNFKF